MFRSMSGRIATVAAVALLLAVLSAPAVQARPLGLAPSADAGAPWIDAAFTWLSQLLFGEAPEPPAENKPVFEAISDDLYQPSSASCVDPEGKPRPCIEL